MVSELVILLSYEGIKDWLWKSIGTMQVTMELVVQRGKNMKDRM
jgi:hypothetical protein